MTAPVTVIVIILMTAPAIRVVAVVVGVVAGNHISMVVDSILVEQTQSSWCIDVVALNVKSEI